MKKIKIEDFKMIDETEVLTIFAYETIIRTGFEHSFYIIINTITNEITFKVYITNTDNNQIIWSDVLDNTTLSMCVKYANVFIPETDVKPNHVSDCVLF